VWRRSPKLSAAGQGALQAQPAVILAQGNFLVLSDKCPALARDKGPEAGLLGFEPQAGLCESRAACWAPAVRIGAWVPERVLVIHPILLQLREPILDDIESARLALSFLCGAAARPFLPAPARSLLGPTG
jgi:hypothetical protein